MKKLIQTNKQFRYIIVGDVHGDLNQFLYPLIDYLSNPENTILIYLGDYFDRGDSDVYIYEIIRLIQEQFITTKVFRNIHFLRGNHECYTDGTVDVIGQINNNTNGPIVSFITDEAMKLDLDLFYYDPNTKILFSHSSYSTSPLRVLLDDNKVFKTAPNLAAIYTCSDESPLTSLYCIKYLNIHGHDHNISDVKDMNLFFKTASLVNNDISKLNPKVRANLKVCSSISLDNEATYGSRVHDNVVNVLKGEQTSCERPYTNLTYLVFETRRENKGIEFLNVKLYNERIYIYDIHDFNSKSFDYIREELMKKCSGFDKLNLQNSCQVFLHNYLSMIRRFENRTHISEKNSFGNNIEILYRYVYRNMSKDAYKGNETNSVKMMSLDQFGRSVEKPSNKIYFHNVPYEIYNAFTHDKQNTQDTQDEYIPTWELFWRSITCGDKILKLIYGK